MAIRLNGELRTFEVEEQLSLHKLVLQLGFQPDRIAIERNGDIAPRGRWAEILLLDGDRVELVHFVGGGAPVRVNKRRSHRSP